MHGARIPPSCQSKDKAGSAKTSLLTPIRLAFPCAPSTTSWPSQRRFGRGWSRRMPSGRTPPEWRNDRFESWLPSRQAPPVGGMPIYGSLHKNELEQYLRCEGNGPGKPLEPIQGVNGCAKDNARGPVHLGRIGRLLGVCLAFRSNKGHIRRHRTRFGLLYPACTALPTRSLQRAI